jgi:hypothetical protein
MRAETEGGPGDSAPAAGDMPQVGSAPADDEMPAAAPGDSAPATGRDA